MLNNDVSPIAVVFHPTIPAIQAWSRSELPEVAANANAPPAATMAVPIDPTRGQRVDILA